PGDQAAPFPQLRVQLRDGRVHVGAGLHLAAGQLELQVETVCPRGSRDGLVAGGGSAGVRLDEQEFLFDSDRRHVHAGRLPVPRPSTTVVPPGRGLVCWSAWMPEQPTWRVWISIS